jgi:hypothetical protein
LAFWRPRPPPVLAAYRIQDPARPLWPHRSLVAAPLPGSDLALGVRAGCECPARGRTSRRVGTADEVDDRAIPPGGNAAEGVEAPPPTSPTGGRLLTAGRRAGRPPPAPTARRWPTPPSPAIADDTPVIQARRAGLVRRPDTTHGRSEPPSPSSAPRPHPAVEALTPDEGATGVHASPGRTGRRWPRSTPPLPRPPTGAAAVAAG